MKLSSVTPLILAYNEESNIERTLSRLTWASRVVVVDSHSEDDTVKIAESFRNVDLVQRGFDNHKNQWNYGLDQVEAEWVLSLDADYQVTPAFVEELEGLEPPSNLVGYKASFTYCVFGRPLRGSLYPSRVVLFRAGRARYVQDGHTQRLSTEGHIEALGTTLYHDDRKPIDQWLSSQKHYAKLEAKKLEAEEKPGFSDRLRQTRILGPLLVPFYCLFRHRLILDGWAGWYYTLQRTYAEILLSLELLGRDLRGDAPNLISLEGESLDESPSGAV